MFRPIISSLLVAACFSAEAAKDSLWNSEFEVGAVVTTGNTDEQNFKVRARVSGEPADSMFKHNLSLDLLNNSKDDEKTAQKLYIAYQTDYKLAEHHSLFSRVAYEDDKFSGFDYQTDFTVGYNRQLIKDAVQELGLAAGVGYRRSVFDNGDSDGEPILRLAGTYQWQVSDTAQFRQLLSMDIGSESTISRSETSLQADISGSLAMKVALLVKHQSEVPLNRDKTDTETSLTLVYRF